ncbi:hypothetical protein [Nocardiopsis sp. NRRL B-16309]|uniref:hypothetical protein n=1 Tax=Nocardiopsis sp. NRRL B-16309 TaxID=1519494 RepID=UPI0006AFBB38|nr:hypothetical protein [Nocardiopsis sp. NRRL B-16309]KOX14016.1 hypothetical protein ADL05_17400 [Nocardiopsis sp. NRRL B-16309]
MSSAATGPRNKRKPQQKKSPAQRAAEAKQADADRAATPSDARLRARLGESGSRSLLALVRGGLVAGSALASYVLAMFAAVTVVPNLFVMVAAGTGVGPTSPLEMQLAHWLAPSVFLIGLVFVLVLIGMRALWRAQLRLAERARHALLGEEPDAAQSTDSAGR